MKRIGICIPLIFVMSFLASCSSSKKQVIPTAIIKSGYDFSKIGVISVLNFVNYEKDVNTGSIVADAVMKELIKRGYSIVESSHLKEVLEAKKIAVPEQIDIDLIRQLRETIKIDALFTGTVTKYSLGQKQDIEYKDKSGRTRKKPVYYDAEIGLNARLIDVKSGSVVWMDSINVVGQDMEWALNESVYQLLNSFGASRY